MTEPEPTVKAALIQMPCDENKERNVDRGESYIVEAAAAGAELICLQELFASVYFPAELDERHFDLAEYIPGPTTERLCALAHDKGVAIAAPLYERTSADLFFNTCAMIDRTGDLVGIYRKSSIPNTPMAESILGREDFYFSSGDTGFCSFPLARGVCLGVLICYDRHFPEAFRSLALQGAQLVLVPTATCGASRTFWESELRTMAVQNQVFIGAPNRVGDEFGGDWYGTSLWIDPAGEVIARAGDTEAEILYADLDMDAVPRQRREWCFYPDRRPDLYGKLIDRAM